MNEKLRNHLIFFQTESKLSTIDSITPITWKPIEDQFQQEENKPMRKTKRKNYEEKTQINPSDQLIPNHLFISTKLSTICLVLIFQTTWFPLWFHYSNHMKIHWRSISTKAAVRKQTHVENQKKKVQWKNPDQSLHLHKSITLANLNSE
jgi:hypothetical protein